MAPRRVVAAASPSSLRRLRLQTDQPLQHRRISRRKGQSLSMRDVRHIQILAAECVATIKEEKETDTETEAEYEAETRWERNTRGDAKTFWVEQLYRYEEL
ncbi:hypothetical protein TARUN_2530 [Trichoderma arundinaceum]|uniref:Uncharacterized protein n=1 Tax=Trichoderma arundinaceum TaxID=490622 RepID=A0A395NUK8_TRIAR|nr:hypothetical protein TARUN_2530 [Trichoderma arundinaceum]